VINKRLHIGIFPDEACFMSAARACEPSDLSIVEAYTPYPIHGLDHVMGIRRTHLPWVTLIAGAIGAAFGFWLQYWTSASDYAVDVGGKPWNSFPAFVPVAFELTILFAGVSTIVAILLRSGLVPGRKPRRRLPGTTDDKFGLIVTHRNKANEWTPVQEFFARHGVIESWEEVAA
jgi:hypothetical protein